MIDFQIEGNKKENTESLLKNENKFEILRESRWERGFYFINFFPLIKNKD